MTKHRLTTLIFCLLTMHGPMTDVATSQVFSFRRYSTRDGLPSNHISTLFQDSRGYIWIGTSDGLCRYTGREFLRYARRDGLPNPLVRGLIEDRNSPGTLWIATGNGLCTYDGSQWSMKFHWPDRTDCTIDALCQDHTGRVWFTVRDTIMVLDAGEVRVVRPPLDCRGIGQIIETGDSVLWFSHGMGVLRYLERTGNFSTIEAARFSDHGNRPMCVDTRGDLWIHRLSEDTTYSTFLRIRGTEIIERRKMRARPNISFLVDDRRGNLLIPGLDGIMRMSLAEPRATFLPFCGEANGLPENDLRSAVIDREGNLWAGGNARGLAALRDWSIIRLSIKGAEAGQRNSVGVADLQDHLWIVAKDGVHELFQDTSRRWQQRLHQFQPPAVSVALDRHGDLWLAFADARLTRYRIEHSANSASRLLPAAQFIPDRDFPNGFPVTLAVDDSDEVWYSLGRVGVVRIGQQVGRRKVWVYGSREGIPENYVRVLLADTLGRIWCGSYQEGLCVIENGHPSTVSTEGVDRDPGIRALFEDRKGRILYGTRAAGLGIIDEGRTTFVNDRDGLPSNTVWSIADDREGRLWLGTLYGAVRIDSLSPLRMTLKDELSTAPVFALGRFTSGMLWFLTVEGVTIYDPADDAPMTPPPPVQITRFMVNGAPRAFESGAVIPYDATTCTIEFVSPSFRDARGVTYRYRIEPAEKEWQGPYAEPRVTYGSLPPGTHRFLVEARSAGGISSASPTTLVITVEAPFWEQAWFLVLAWILAGGILAGGIRWIELRKFRRRMAALEREQALEKERLRIARDMHDEIGSTLTEISILGDLGRQAASSPSRQSEMMDAMAGKSREVLASITEIIWAINPRNDELDNLAGYVRRYASRFCEQAGLRCRVSIPDDLPATRLSMEQRRNLFLVVKESLNNVVKHAGASEVELCVSIVDGDLSLEIADNGRGFQPDGTRDGGTGLSSMRNRVEEIGGNLSITSGPGVGTRVSVYLKRGIAGKEPIR